jgi:hypothetical protein
MLNLRQQAEIQNSTLDRVQQGMANFQSSTIFKGIQIFSGTGGMTVGLVGSCC